MAWLHTWAGLIFGWLLFAIFLTGTLSYFKSEISHWTQPEIPYRTLDTTASLSLAQRYLQTNAADAGSWFIQLPEARDPTLRVGWRAPGAGRRDFNEKILDPATGNQLHPRDSSGGEFFYRFHFQLQMPYPWGRWLSTFCALMMLVGLVTGIITHKKIFKEFFTFRPGKGQRSWLDFHNASAVLLLPFHLMITYTGLVIFLLIYMPAAVDALFEGDNQAYYKAQGEQRLPTPRAALKQPAALVDLAPVLASAQERLGAISSIGISNPGTAAARIEVRPTLGYRIALSKGQAMVFDGVSGELLRDVPDMRPAVLTQRVMAGLHFAQFGGYPMRWLYFVCALVSTAMIGTGLVLFCVKRRRKYASASVSAQRWYKVAESFNVAFVAGLMLACAGLLWANRLLPVELAQRANWEVKAFFAVWLLSLLHAGLRPAQRAWAEQLGLTAVLCIGLPVLGALTAQHDPAHRVLEATSVVLGGLLAYAAWRCVAPREEKPARKRATVAVEGQ